MKFLSGLFETKAAPRSTPTSRASNTPYLRASIGSSWDVEKSVTNAYEKVQYVFRCVDAIATNQAKVKAIVENGLGEQVDHRAVFKLLNRRANSYETAWQLRYRLSSQLLLSSRGAFLEIVKSRSGDVVELHLLPPHLVEPIPDPELFVSGYKLTNQITGEEILEPERVIWVRTKPHPLDPYKQMTPLMAAGLAAETDYLARMFNRNFLINDGRPGMLVNVRGQMNREDMQELKNRFSGGANVAGQTTVIDGAEGIDAQDFGASPREASWLEAVRMSKEDILTAFGVPESIMGNASGRTFANADTEKDIFWNETMLPHMSGIGRGLDALTGNIDDNMDVSFDYASVPELQRAAEARRQTKAGEVASGLATIDDYFEHMGLPKWDVLGTRILINAQGVPIARNPEDQEEADKLQPIGMPDEGAMGGGMPMGMSGQPSALSQSRASQAGAQRGAAIGQQRAADTQAATAARQSSAYAPQGGFGQQRYKPSAATARVVGWGAEGKALTGMEQKGSDDFDAIQHLTGFLDGAFGSWSDRQQVVLPERLSHAKVRKGTRHWDDDSKSDGSVLEYKALDAMYVVQPDIWRADVTSTVQRRVVKVASQTANRTARELLASGVVTPRGTGSQPLVRLIGSRFTASSVVSRALMPAMDIVSIAVSNHSQKIIDTIIRMESDGAELPAIQKQVRDMMKQNSEWRTRLAGNVAHMVTEGVRTAVYQEAGVVAQKTWKSTLDDRVRDTHRAANGQVRFANEPFLIGAALLQYPCDPAAPPEETINCRCRLEWKV